MAIRPEISLATRAPDVGQIFNNALVAARGFQGLEQQRGQAPIQNRLLESRAAQGEANVNQAQRLNRATDIAFGASELLPDLNTGNFAGAATKLAARRQRLLDEGKPTETTDEAIALLNTDPQSLLGSVQQIVNVAQQQGILEAPGGGLTAGQRETNSLVNALVGAINPTTKQPFTEQEARREVALRDAGITARAVGSAVQTITKADIAKDVADTEEILAGGKETGKLDAQGRLQPNIDKQRALAKDAAGLSTQIFGRIENVEGNIRNMEEGIRLIDEGANVGPVDKWLPSLRESTVKMDNLKNRLGLDVIGSVTFGALSAGELKTAFDTAVPQNLRGEGLKRWFGERIELQGRLLNSLEEAGIFLAEEGASIPKLMAKRRADRKGAQQAPAQPAAPQPTQAPAQPRRFVFNPETGRLE